MYNKLFTKILDSSIWMESMATRIVWMTFIAAMDEDGFVEFASPANVAHRAVVPLDQTLEALKVLEGPDVNSADPENEGRRIERVPGGWMVLNALKYKDLVTRATKKESNRVRVAKHRAKKKGNAPVTPCNATSPSVTQSESESQADTDDSTPSPSSNRDNTTSTTARLGRNQIKGIDKNAAKAALIGEDPCPMARAFGCTVNPNNAHEWRREASKLKLRMVDLLMLLDYAHNFDGLNDPVRLPSGLSKAYEAMMANLTKQDRKDWADSIQASYGFK